MNRHDDRGLSRRTVLAFAAGAGASVLCPSVAFAKAEFWNQKDPSEWTAEEIHQLLTKSPWAKEVDTQAQRSGEGQRRRGGMSGGIPGLGLPPLGGGYPGGGYPGGGYPGGGYPGGGGYPRRRGGYPGGEEGGAFRYQVTVRWESALPVRAALKDPPPEATSGNYVISVNGLPEHIPNPRRSTNDDDQNTDTSDDPQADEKRTQARLDRLKENTTLEPKGGSPMRPVKVVRQESTSGSYLFIFDKTSEPLTDNAKEVTFITRMGPVEVKTKFNLKDMKYKGGLAV